MRTLGVYRFTPLSIFALIMTSAISALAFTWPFWVSSDEGSIQLIFWLAMPFALLLLLASLSNKSLDAKSIALLGVLAALFTALRPLGAGAVGIEPMWFLLILATRVFGAAFGFLLGVIGMIASAALTGGFGPWLVYQVFAAGWIALGVAIIPKRFRGTPELLALALYGVVASAAFGVLMDLQFWPWALGTNTQLSYLPGDAVTENLQRFFIFHFATSMAWDIPRAVITATLILLFGSSVLNALRRSYVRASFLAPIEFRDLSSNERVRAQREL